MSLRFLAGRTTNNLIFKRFYAKPPLKGPSGQSDHCDGGHKLYKSLSLFLALPLIAIVTAKCYADKQEEKVRPAFIPYEYLRIRTKRFPWGDGNHSFMHNDYTNPLPDGYVDGYQNDECDEE